MNRKGSKLWLFFLTLTIIFSIFPSGLIVVKANDNAYEGYKQLGAIDSYQKNEYDVVLTVTTGEKIRVQFYKDNLVRIYMDPTGQFQEYPTPNNSKHETKMLVKTLEDYKKDSLAVKPEATEKDGAIVISSKTCSLIIDKATSRMKLLEGSKVIWEETKPLNYSSNNTIQTLKNHDNEYYYGGGTQNGSFSHRGEKINIVNENNWVDGGVASPAPFYWSTYGYGVIRHTFKPGEYDFGNTDSNTVITSHKESRMDAIYFVGDTPNEILDEYTEVSGRPAFMPEFTFYPNHLNAYNRDTWVEVSEGKGILFEDGKYYKEYQPGSLGNLKGFKETLNGNDQFSARAVIQRYIKNDMPLGWFLPNDGYGAGYGQTDSLDGDIQNLKEFTEYANSLGIQTGLWTQSDIHPVDPENPKKGERDIEKEIKVAGVRSQKTDVAWVGYGYDFGLDGVADISRILNEDVNARQAIITLDGWVGTQRYASIWTGDQTGGQWEYIRFHIPTYIGTGLSGNPNVTSDMDGIFGGSPLIMTRDTQWKAFTPMMLYMDGWGSYQKNPWEHGEPYASINRTYLKLKSELLPYTYSIAKEANETGLPMVRAMFLEYPNEYTYSSATEYQYMWGSNFLVAPVYQDTNMDSTTYDDIRNGIYLPEGETWIDYFTGEQYEGGQILNYFDAPFWKLPLFVKNGSIIPMYKPSNNPEQIDRSYRIFDIYADGASEFDVYEDDGESMDYEDGDFANTRVTSKVEDTSLTVNIEKTRGSYPEMVKERATELKLHVSEEPTRVTAKIGGAEVQLTKVSTEEEFEKADNAIFYEESPNMNKYSTEGSSFESVEIINSPVLRVKLSKADVTANEVNVVIEGFKNDGTKPVDDQAVPSVPANFNPSKISHSEIELAWDGQENADTYEIEFQGQVYSNIGELKFKFLDLSPNTEYSFRLRARNTKGASDWSQVITVKTELDPLRNAVKAQAFKLSATDQGGTPIANMFDLDPSTAWHTTWGMSQTPMDLVIDLGLIYQLDELQYIPRNDAGNGTITKYSLDYSVDGKHWVNGPDMSWARSGDIKLHDFKDIEARYLKLNIKEAVGGFGSGSEFFIMRDDKTEGVMLGDTNASNTVDDSDLTFFTNYAGLNATDSDYNGYVSKHDYNGNGLIDAYDINLVQAIKAKRATGDTKNISGTLSYTMDKNTVNKGEKIKVTVTGKDLYDLNAFSLELGYDAEKFKVVSITPGDAVKGWTSFSKVRKHSDDSNDIYVIYGNEGNNSINGEQVLSYVELEALADNQTLVLDNSHSMLVDRNLFYKDGKGVDDPEVDRIVKIPHTDITLTGDESAYEKAAGAPLSNINDGNRGTFGELMWDWEPNHDENGNLPENVKLPQELTLTPNTKVNKLNQVVVVKRAGGNGSVKNIQVDVYNGKEKVLTKQHTFAKTDQLEEIALGDIEATKVVVTVFDTYDENNKNAMMTLAEIELYENLAKDPVELLDTAELEAKALNPEDYEDFTAVSEAIAAIEEFLRTEPLATEIEKAEALLTSLSKAIKALKVKEAPEPPTELEAPKFTELPKEAWIKGSEKGLIFKANGDLEDLIKILVDDKELAKEDYTATKGSTIVELKPAFLDKLTAGSHSLTLEFKEGSEIAAGKITSTFEIAQAGSEVPVDPEVPVVPETPVDPEAPVDKEPIENDVPKETAPKTGDNGVNIYALAALASGTIFVILQKKKNMAK